MNTKDVSGALRLIDHQINELQDKRNSIVKQCTHRDEKGDKVQLNHNDGWSGMCPACGRYVYLETWKSSH